MATNTQRVERMDRDPSGSVAVHSMFNTIQGEGPFVGHAALFIRLYGCNLQCPGCDTDYTSARNLMAPADVVLQVMAMGANPGRVITDHIIPPNTLEVGDRISVALPTRGRLIPGDIVVITGGEPFRQNITPLVSLLIRTGYTVQIETNGTLYLPDFPYGHAVIVCSPKTANIHPKLAPLVTAYKYVLSADDIADDGLPIHALGHDLGNGEHVARPPDGWHGPVFLQPMDTQDDAQNAENLLACAATVMEKKGDYILGVQIHKQIGLP